MVKKHKKLQTTKLPISNNTLPVKTNNDNSLITISLKKFKNNSININKEFNNHFKNQNEGVDFFNDMILLLKTLTEKTVSVFSDRTFLDRQHIHKISNDKLCLLEKILKKYQLNQQSINEIIDGQKVYQIAKDKSGGRLIFELNDNVIYPLFIDPNHHLYPIKQYFEETFDYKYNIFSKT